MAASVDEESILKYRILTGLASTRGEAPIKKVLKCWQSLAADLKNGTIKDAENSSRALAMAFSALQAQARKLEAACNACVREQQHYETLTVQLQDAIKIAEEDITRLKTDLEDARQVRKNNEQYEALRERIMQLPSRAASTQEMERINEQRDAAANECAKLVQAIEWRKRQFALLCHQLEELQQVLDDDDMPVVLDTTDPSTRTNA